MAVFVRWEWKEKTKTFLVIFYFIDDKTEQNIRFRFKVVNDLESIVFLEDPTNNPDMASQPIMTWAPSHLEIALLGDVLRYANIIDGLDKPEKRKLREKLEIQVKEGHPNLVHEEDIDDLIRDAPPSTTILGLEGASDWFFCSRLNSEYVDYLREVMMPFQSS